MMTHAIYPGLTELPLCAGVAYDRGEGPGRIVLRFDHRYDISAETKTVNCPECREWVHA